jgi:hypothetical protein
VRVALAGGDGEPGGVGIEKTDEVENLPGVPGGVGEAAHQGLLDAVALTADGDGFIEVGFLKAGECLIYGVPTGLPARHERGARVVRGEDEFAVAIASRLFAVRGEKVGPAGEQIAAEMLDDQCDRIDLLAGAAEEGIVVELAHGALGELAMAAEFVAVVWEEVIHRAECGERLRPNLPQWHDGNDEGAFVRAETRRCRERVLLGSHEGRNLTGAA